MSFRPSRCISSWRRSDCSDIGHLLVYGQGSLFHLWGQESAADARARRQLDLRRSLRRRRRLASGPPVRQALIVLGGHDHGATPLRQPMLGDDFYIAVDLDAAAAHRFTHQHSLTRIPEGNRVAIAAIAEQAVLGHTAIFHVAGVVIGLIVEEQQPLFRKPIIGYFPRGGVLLVIDLFHPDTRLLVQVSYRVEGNAGPKVLLHETNGRLNLALRLGAVGAADPWYEAVVSGEL